MPQKNLFSCAFLTLGCKVNIYESEALASGLAEQGFYIVPWEQEADIYVINGCAVTAQAEAKTRQAARRVKREHPRAKLVLLGCYSAAAPEQASELGADLVLDNSQKPHLAEVLQRFLAEDAAATAWTADIADAMAASTNTANMADTPPCFAEYPTIVLSQHTRPLLKIQDGCNSRCTYCLIPKLRGAERSRPLQSVLREAAHLGDLGYRELILTGIHLSRWGHDLQPKQNLAALLRALLALDYLPRLRLSSVEPTDIDDELIALLVTNSSRLCPHLHIPLQSGCDATLERMGRRYRAEDYRRLLQKLRRALPDIALTTDLIVGFPGESETEFAQTVNFCAEMSFSRMHIFRFSERKGTAAASMPHRVPKAIQEERSVRMHELSRRMSESYAVRFVGREVQVLLEQKEQGIAIASGYSEHYLVCAVPYQPAVPREGLLGTVRVQRSDASGLYGDFKSL